MEPKTNRGPRTIYALRDPVTSEARWIGETCNALVRYRNHLAVARSNADKGMADPREVWIAETLAGGRRPILHVLEVGVPYERRFGTERLWIEAFAETGHRVFNILPRCAWGRWKPWKSKTWLRCALSPRSAGAGSCGRRKPAKSS